MRTLFVCSFVQSISVVCINWFLSSTKKCFKRDFFKFKNYAVENLKTTTSKNHKLSAPHKKKITVEQNFWVTNKMLEPSRLKQLFYEDT